jgi:dolichyl-phosphate beta-glucosyltransferase
MFLSIVIPVWQEAKRLHRTFAGIERLRDALPYQPEVIFVDDGSTDSTVEIIKTKKYRVIVQGHRGKGAAVRTGMLAANGLYRMAADADWSMPPEQALMMLPPFQSGFDIAIASRERPGAVRTGEPLHRHLVGRAFNRAVQTLVLPGIEDTQCGFKVFRAEAARAIFSRTREDGWAFDVEALALARAFGMRIAEVPIDWNHDKDSRVRTLRDGPSMLTALFRIRTRLALSAYPLPSGSDILPLDNDPRLGL